MHPTQISCLSLDWRGVVVLALNETHEINLVHFLFTTDVEFCEDVAAKYAVDFTANPKRRTAFFRKQTHGLPKKAGTPPKISANKVLTH